MAGAQLNSDENAPVKPSRMQTLGIRAASGIILLAICGLPIYFGGWVMAIFIAMVSARVVYEWVRMSDPDGLKTGLKAALVVPVVGLWAAIAFGYVGQWRSAFAVVALTSGVATIERLRRGRALWAGLGALYVLLPSMAILWIRGDVVGVNAAGFAKFMFIVMVVITADTWAYLGGSTLGGPKMAPKISPNKTWSGFISGFVFGLFMGALCAWIIGFSPLRGAMLAAPIVILAVLGDLLESVIKRTLKVKDAGGLIPGHGGFLDRIDSLLLSVAIAAIALVIWPSIWPSIWSPIWSMVSAV